MFALAEKSLLPQDNPLSFWKVLTANKKFLSVAPIEPCVGDPCPCVVSNNTSSEFGYVTC